MIPGRTTKSVEPLANITAPEAVAVAARVSRRASAVLTSRAALTSRAVLTVRAVLAARAVLATRAVLTARAVLTTCAAAAALAAATALAGCGGGHARVALEDSIPPLAAEVQEARERQWPEAAGQSAEVLPLRRAAPGTILMGRVEKVLHREGDKVAAGAALAQIETREVQARLAQAEAGVSAARAMELNARQMRERMERLHARQAATQKNLDDAVAGHAAAVAGLDAAEQAVHAARMYVSYAEVRAPFAGVITERRIEVGDLAAPGMPLFVIEDLSKVKIEAAVAESVARSLRAGQSVRVSVPAAGPEPREGTIGEILPSADPRSRTFLVRVLLDNAGGTLRSGMFARLQLGAAVRTALTVPETALLRQGPLTGLFVVDGAGVARLRWVATGAAREGAVEVLSGLARDERVVVSPPPGLQDGRRVEAR